MERIPKKAEGARIRSGRRSGTEIEEPRDKTVCFLVTESEKQSIDFLAASLCRTRSAVLARIVTSFVEDCEGDGGEGGLLALLEECRGVMGGGSKDQSTIRNYDNEATGKKGGR